MAGFELNIIKWSAKIVKVVGEHLQWLGATSQNFETLTSLNGLKLYFWRFFALNEQSNWSKYQFTDVACSCVKKFCCMVCLVKARNRIFCVTTFFKYNRKEMQKLLWNSKKNDRIVLYLKQKWATFVMFKEKVLSD